MTIKHNGDIECHINDLDAHIEALRKLGKLPERPKQARARQSSSSPTRTTKGASKHNALSLVFMIIMGLAMMGMIHSSQTTKSEHLGFIK